MPSPIEKLSGCLVWSQDQRPLAHVQLTAYDKDLFSSDTLGQTRTDINGNFTLSFPRSAYSHGGPLGEHQPDVYLVVINPLTHERVQTPVLPICEWIDPEGVRTFGFALRAGMVSPAEHTDPDGFLSLKPLRIIEGQRWRPGNVQVPFQQHPLLSLQVQAAALTTLPKHENRRVLLRRPYALAGQLVSQHLWQLIMDENSPAAGPTSAPRQTRLQAARSADWQTALHFCNRLSQRYGRTPFYILDPPPSEPDPQATAHTRPQVGIRPDANGFRLPSYTEWIRSRGQPDYLDETDPAPPTTPTEAGELCFDHPPEAGVLPVDPLGHPQGGPDQPPTDTPAPGGTHSPPPQGHFRLACFLKPAPAPTDDIDRLLASGLDWARRREESAARARAKRDLDQAIFLLENLFPQDLERLQSALIGRGEVGVWSQRHELGLPFLLRAWQLPAQGRARAENILRDVSRRLRAQIDRLSAAGSHTEAEPLLTNLLDIECQLSGEQNPDLAQTLYHLGRSCRLQQKLQLATGFLERARAVSQALPSPDTAQLELIERELERVSQQRSGRQAPAQPKPASEDLQRPAEDPTR